MEKPVHQNKCEWNQYLYGILIILQKFIIHQTIHSSSYTHRSCYNITLSDLDYKYKLCVYNGTFIYAV